MPHCAFGYDISITLNTLRGIGGFQAAALAAYSGAGLTGGAAVTSLSATYLLPGVIALYGGGEIGFSANGLYENFRGNSLGSDIYDLAHFGHIFNYSTPSTCGCSN